eukprot:TRINITY_DN437_c0_g1_i2.p1 TRINITY_DN437_c0_g1~~TRINITY_DN437_c0_g1_i2.p1  ORF type:complete len:122 (+),score=16.60 TRINITY_DN437_c0_g1_i2:133-498(+)
MPPRIWMPNFPLVLRLKAPKQVHPPVKMPPAGMEGSFKTTEIVLETVPQLTKPEMMRFLRTVYGLDVKRINSVNVMGHRHNDQSRMPRRDKDYKRFYVKLNHAVELPNVPKALHIVKDAAD